MGEGRNPIGSIVKIEGLQSKPELHGATGVVLSKDAASGRFAVRVTALPDGSAPEATYGKVLEMKLKPECVGLSV